MNQREFKKLVKARQKHTNETLLAKGVEYARAGDSDNNFDRLHSFHQAAAMNNETAAQSLWGMYTKHIISVKDMVDNTAIGIYPTDEQIQAKIGDSINYNHLLEGIFIADRPVVLQESLCESNKYED